LFRYHRYCARSQWALAERLERSTRRNHNGGKQRRNAYYGNPRCEYAPDAILMQGSEYSFSQLETLWTNAGGDPSVAPQMAAIAIAESSGNPTASHTDSDGTTDYGLWQINSVHGFNSAGLTSNPAYNAQAAVAVYNSQGFGAWSTYGNSNYETALSQNGFAALGNVSGGASTMNTPVAPATPLTNVLTGVFGEYGAWITNNNVNVLYKAVFLCLALLVFAAIPLTNKFAGYAAFGILFLLIIQEPDPNPAPVSLFNSGVTQAGV
jgi:hypothetical protein